MPVGFGKRVIGVLGQKSKRHARAAKLGHLPCQVVRVNVGPLSPASSSIIPAGTESYHFPTRFSTDHPPARTPNRKMVKKKSAKKATLRDTLLPKLLSGEVRVGDAAALDQDTIGRRLVTLATHRSIQSRSPSSRGADGRDDGLHR